MPIYSVAHYITVGESAGINGLKCLMLRLIFVLAISKIEISDLHEIFL